MKDKSNNHIFSKNKGFNLLGIGKQDAIKYFFGGNALVSIIVLVLITVFLAKEAFLFFPDYKTNLTIYRKSGKEYADYIDNQRMYQEELRSLATKIRQYELYEKVGVDAYIPKMFVGMKNKLSEKIQSELLAVKISKERIADKKFIWKIWSKKPEKKALVEQQKKDYFAKLESAQKALDEKVAKLAKEIEISDLEAEFKKTGFYIKSKDPSIHAKLQDALIEHFKTASDKLVDPEIVSQSKVSKEDKVKRLTGRTSLNQALSAEEIAAMNLSPEEVETQKYFENLYTMQNEIVQSLKDFTAFYEKLRESTLLVSLRSEAFQSTAAKKEAIELGIPRATPEKKEQLLIQSERLITEEQDYDKLAEAVYATLPPHKDLLSTMMERTQKTFGLLPAKDSFTNKEVKRDIYSELSTGIENYESFMLNERQKMEDWRHDKAIGWGKTIAGFFFGEKWVANSSWNNFFGLRPLFGGSFFITIIAVSIATPFAVGGAIYVNRLSTPLEQTIVKPIIEFIQAIPSVVLAFLGVIIVGQQILDLSYIPWLSWIDGFPASGEQMMLTAGVLLAFMAIPTMFTLAEDAINNVPKSYNEASLALGATKLQTVFKVIVPCSLSGIIAAVLLGFGRIIGETMVVLLVAGGTIDWPETWTSPVHTMTGIIAQSTGEAAPGSIQYRSLFLVGLVLFCISLALNSLAQKVIKKFGNKA